jgi:hypothetical protein
MEFRVGRAGFLCSAESEFAIHTLCRRQNVTTQGPQVKDHAYGFVSQG